MFVVEGVAQAGSHFRWRKNVNRSGMYATNVCSFCFCVKIATDVIVVRFQLRDDCRFSKVVDSVAGGRNS